MKQFGLYLKVFARRASEGRFASLFAAVCLSFGFCFSPSFVCVVRADEMPNLEYGEPRQLCKLENKSVNESSGLAASRLNEGLFWTHNDSGDKPRLYCFDRDGKHQGTCKLKRAGAVDWEDMCSFEINGHAKLLIGDTGDNGVRRKSCRLYLIDEPSDPSDDVKKMQVVKLRYSTGPMDCEAIGVDVASQKLLLVEKKRWINCRVFEADFPLDQETGNLLGQQNESGLFEVVAKPIGILRVSIVAGMDVSGDGLRAIVSTLGQAYEFRRGIDETWKEAFTRTPRKIHMPARRQGETICYGRDGRDLFLTSELRPTPFFVVPALSKSR